METFNQYGVWFALGYPIIKEIIIPVARKIIPAKVKNEIKVEQEKQKHEFAMEQKRLDAEIEFKRKLTETLDRQTETQAALVEISRSHDEQIKEIRRDTTEIKETLKRSTRKAVK